MDDNSRGGDWPEMIHTHRTEKEAAFASESDTPLSETARAQFDGLAFFPISAEYRLTGRLEPFEEPRDVTLDTTQGPPMSFEKVGQLGLELDGEFSVLAAYRAPGVPSLLVPFRDSTNGSTTWKHGRYLNVAAPKGTAGEEDQIDRARPVDVTVDFNLAYHPLCVYDETVRSAKPPTDSELSVAIRAGERL
ncbi:MAG: DUF1684 domain-containing protein [Halodesulfurarchaeum sp.]